MDLMAEGTYDAVTKSAVLYESKENALMCVFDIEVSGRIMKGWVTLAKKGGDPYLSGIRNVQDIMGWTGWDWAAFEGAPSDFGGKPCSVVIATESDQQGNPESKIKWVNAPGSGIQKADAKAMASKYGAKFRAVLGGGTPTARPTPAQRPMQAPTAATSSTMPECWAALCDAMKGKPQDVIEAAWFRLIEKVGGGKAPEAMSAAEWGAAKVLITSVPKSTAAAPKPTPAPEPEPTPEPGNNDDPLPF